MRAALSALEWNREADYSAIEHVARILLSSNWKDAIMVMLTTSFDVSIDQPEQKFLVMAGFVSSADRWGEFDRAWRARLARDDLPYFHMHPFAHSIGIFTGWDSQEQRRRTLLSDLLNLISEHVYYKFGVTVQTEASDALAITFRTDYVTAIEVAGRVMAIEVESWRRRNKYRNQAEHVFEDGDLGKGRLASAVKGVTGMEPLFRSKKDIPDKGIVGFTPLQASDILAYELKKLSGEASMVTGMIKHGHIFRFPYEQLNRIQGQPRLWNLLSSTHVDQVAKVDRYFKENPLI